MPEVEEEETREILNQAVWDQSSDELRQLKLNRYASGESDGQDIPRDVRRLVRRGSLFGKAVGIAIFLGFGYLLFWFGGALSRFVSSLFY